MRLVTAVITALALTAAALVLVLIGTGTVGGPASSYRVHALFDNAGFAVPGEEVRVAGAPAGTITALSVTRDDLAAVTLSITDSRFTPWYSNAHCTIRPQSLIAERYIDCTPGSVGHGALPEITRGQGAGSHLLAVARTSSPVDPGIVQDISRESVRESLSLIIDQLGTGLAARGSALNAVILRANPALAQTDRVFKLLGSQSRQLARLATDAHALLAPLSRVRGALAGFVASADTTATAAADRNAELARSIKLLPPFLERMRPLLADLQDLAAQGTPVMSELGLSARSLDAEFKNLKPFAATARTALVNLANAAARSEHSLVAAQPLADRLKSLGAAALPPSTALHSLTSSLSASGGIQQLMRLLFYGATATNGYDADGHYVRLTPIVGSCTAYAKVPVAGCSANFSAHTGATSEIARRAARAALASARGSERTLGSLLRYLTGSPSS